MKFISILRKTHIPDEYAVTHPWIAMLIFKEEVVLRVHGKPVLWQLRPIPAMLLHYQPVPGHTL